MIRMNVDEVSRNIDELWDAASREPVTIESAGKSIAVVLSPEKYEKLTSQREPRQPGFAKELLAGVDVDALLATPIDDIFEDYM